MMSITQGPCNLMLFAVGANPLWRRALTQHLGSAAAFGLQLVAASAGLGILLAHWPHLGIALQWLGAGGALYPAWQLLRSRHPDAEGRGAPLIFSEVAALQFLNPRAWLLALAAAAVLLPPLLEQMLTGSFTGRI